MILGATNELKFYLGSVEVSSIYLGSNEVWVSALAWDISTAIYNQNFSLSGQVNSPTSIFFSPDGLKMYSVTSGFGDNYIYEYNLSLAWDISTASFNQNFGVSSQENGMQGLFFRSDGLKVYAIGSSGDAVYEYNLSTAWDISTSSYNQNFSVSTEETSPLGLFFKPDGLKMYTIGSSGDAVYEYNLSTAWDISTASYSQNFGVSTEETSPSDLFFKPDGFKMYVVGFSGDAVYEYNLSTAWDISTSSYNQNFSVSTEETSPSGLFFKPDGLKMYVVGASGRDVNEYDIG
jgi:DNA-binding beta-propeller fold protein YncE